MRATPNSRPPAGHPGGFSLPGKPGSLGKDVAKVHLVLKELEPGHYLAEFSGAAQGMWRLLSHDLPERYQAEMVYREGRLKPLVYREEILLWTRGNTG